MAAEEVHVARLGAWVARTLAASGSFAVDLDTDGLGFQMPETVANDPAVKAAGGALAEAGNALRSGADSLDAAMLSGDSSVLTKAFLQLFEGLYRYIDAADAIVERIRAKAATLPAPQANATLGFVTALPRRLMDLFVAGSLEEQLPRLYFLLTLLGIVDRRVIEASGALGEPRFVRTAIRLDRIKTLFQHPDQLLADVYGWGTAAFDPMPVMRAALAFYDIESSARAGLDGPDAYLRVGPFLWKRDATASPPGLMLDASTSFTKKFDERAQFDSTWGMDFTTDVAAGGGLVFRLRPPFDVAVQPKTGTASGAVSFLLNRDKAAPPMTIIGGNDLLKLSAQNVGVGAELAIGASTSGPISIDPGVIGELKQLTIELGTQDADSFLGIAARPPLRSRAPSISGSGGSSTRVWWYARQAASRSPSRCTRTWARHLRHALHRRQDQPGRVVRAWRRRRASRDGSARSPQSWSGSAPSRPSRSPVRPTRTSDRSSLSLGFKPPNGVGLSVDAGIVTRRRLPLSRSRQGRIRRRARTRLLRLPGAQGDRHHQHPDARRLQGLLAAGHHHRRVRHPDPARLRFHPHRRRRPARPQPDDEARGAGRGCAHRRGGERHVPARRRRQRAADHLRPTALLSGPAEHLPDRADGQARLGHTDTDQRIARRHHRGAARQHRDPRRPEMRSARRGCRAAGSAGEVHRRTRGGQEPTVVLRLALRQPGAVHDHRR